MDWIVFTLLLYNLLLRHIRPNVWMNPTLCTSSISPRCSCRRAGVYLYGSEPLLWIIHTRASSADSWNWRARAPMAPSTPPALQRAESRIYINSRTCCSDTAWPWTVININNYIHEAGFAAAASAARTVTDTSRELLAVGYATLSGGWGGTGTPHKSDFIWENKAEPNNHGEGKELFMKPVAAPLMAAHKADLRQQKRFSHARNGERGSARWYPERASAPGQHYVSLLRSCSD